MSCLSPHGLADYLAGRLSSSDRHIADTHIRECPRCRQTALCIGGARHTLDEIATQPAPCPSPAAHVRCEAALRWARPQAPSAIGDRRIELRRGIMLGLVAFAVGSAAFWVAFYTTRRSTAVSAPAILAHAEHTTAPTAREPPAKVHLVSIFVSGDVRLHHAGRDAPLTAMQPLPFPSTLSTGPGGQCRLQWAEGNGLQLDPDSALEIVQFDRTTQELVLRSGRLSLRDEADTTTHASERLRLVTPEPVVLMRDAWVVVAASHTGTTVDVLEGQIDVLVHDETLRLKAPLRASFRHGVAADLATMSDGELALLRRRGAFALPAWNGATGAPHLGDSSLGEPVWPVVAEPPPRPMPRSQLAPPQPRRLGDGSSVVPTPPAEIGPEPGELRPALRAQAEPPRLQEESRSPIAEVYAVIAAQRRAITACYEHALKRDPTLRGSIHLRLRINAQGRVAATTIEQDTLGSADVLSCLKREATRWQFTRVRNVSVVYPFDFHAP